MRLLYWLREPPLANPSTSFLLVQLARIALVASVDLYGSHRGVKPTPAKRRRGARKRGDASSGIDLIGIRQTARGKTPQRHKLTPTACFQADCIRATSAAIAATKALSIGAILNVVLNVIRTSTTILPTYAAVF